MSNFILGGLDDDDDLGLSIWSHFFLEFGVVDCSPLGTTGSSPRLDAAATTAAGCFPSLPHRLRTRSFFGGAAAGTLPSLSAFDDGVEMAEEEQPLEEDPEVDPGGTQDDPPDRFEMVDREGAKWEVRCARRRSERMSTLNVRSLDGHAPSAWRQYLQFNDKVWPEATDQEREEMSDKAIKDTITFGC